MTKVSSPPGTYVPFGATAPVVDPGGYYSGANATAPIQDPAGTYTSPNAMVRLVVDWQNIVPEGEMLYYTSETQVANYFGVNSTEDDEAKTYFNDYAGIPGVALLFTREPLGQRPHLLGANLAGDSVATLAAINGTLTLPFDGFTYSGTVNLSNVAGLTQPEAVAQAATDIEQALNQKRQTAAVINGTITPETVTFMGSIDKAQLTVDSVTSGEQMVVGGIISGAGITSGTNSQVIHDIDGAGGPGHYSTFHSQHASVPEEEMTETYGVLTVNSISQGTVALGEQVTGAGIEGLAPATGIDTNLTAGGTGGVGSTWIVNNNDDGETVTETMTMKAPLIGAYEDRNGQPIVGKTENNELLDISPQGEFGFDENSSTIGYMGGAAATALGLDQEGGADLPSPGGQHMSIAHFLKEAESFPDQYGNIDGWGSVFLNDPRFEEQMTAWADSKAAIDDGGGVQYLTTFTAAGTGMPITDPEGSTSAAGASEPTWPKGSAEALALLWQAPAIETGRSFSQETNSAYALTVDAVGHGHGPGSGT